MVIYLILRYLKKRYASITSSSPSLKLTHSQRRREQNRIAQRAFRERKETRLKQLEKRIAELKTEQRCLERRYNDLRTAHLRLQSGLKILLDASGTFDGRNSELLDFAKDFDE